MSDILCVTNRRLCREDFLVRIEKIAASRPAGIILREKDLTEKEYEALAVEVLAICRQYHTPCILHSFAATAEKLGCRALHLPLPRLRSLSAKEKENFTILGASCHSVADAMESEALGCTYITAGHIFDTDCKKGLPGRGLGFLQEICSSVSLPVYAIGGINAENLAQVKAAGAKGACIMSTAMMCDDVKKVLGDLS
ncbi:MAG: thiamine phosphate synthase [Acutalibacteraceae bacterium]